MTSLLLPRHVVSAVMVLGSLLCAALVPPETVVRADGGHVQVEAMPPWTAELQGMGELLRQPRVVLLLPFFAYSNWFYTYEFGTFNAGIFNARTQVCVEPPMNPGHFDPTQTERVTK
jgi:hypothetical protein